MHLSSELQTEGGQERLVSLASHSARQLTELSTPVGMEL